MQDTQNTGDTPTLKRPGKLELTILSILAAGAAFFAMTLFGLALGAVK